MRAQMFSEALLAFWYKCPVMYWLTVHFCASCYFATAGRSYMGANPPKVNKILNVLHLFQLWYDVRSMAVLANPDAWGTWAIGFASFGGLTTFFDNARVVLVSKLCIANPPAPCKLHHMRRSFHELVDCTYLLLFICILLHYPSVFNYLPRKLVVELWECGDRIGLAKESVSE